MSTAHRTVVVVADDGTSPVGSDEWNGFHNTSIPDGGASSDTHRTVLATTERLIAAGAGRDYIAEPVPPFRGSFDIGTFEVLTDNYQLQYKRTTLAPGARATLAGTGELFLFDLAPNGRLILAGRGL
jgi:hypothetical protein